MRTGFFFPFVFLTRSLALALVLVLAGCSSPEQRASAHYKSGQELLEAGDHARAGLEFRTAVQLDDKNADAWFGLATVDQKSGNWGVALADLKRVVELDPKHVEARIQLAKLLLAAIDLDAALSNVNAANELRKDDSEILALRGAILFRLNDREGARADAERALALDPNNSDAHATLAADAMLDGNAVAALQFINRGLVNDASNLGLLLFKLKIHDDAKDDQNTEAVLRQIIQFHPEIKEIRQALLFFLNSRERFAEVETEMRAMLAADPDNSELALDLIRLIGRVQSASAARDELQKLIAAHPEINAYKLAMAQFDFSEKKIDAATASLNAIIAKGEPKVDVNRARLLLASIRLQLRDIDSAKTLIEEVLQADAKNFDALGLRANIKLDAGDTDGAIIDLREALGQKPDSVPLVSLLARTLERQGTIDLAAQQWSEAVKLSNYAPKVTLEYVTFLGRRDKKDQVETVLSDAISRHPEDRSLLTALARFKLGQQDWEGAQRIAEALKKLGDGSGLDEQILATSLLGQKKFDESIAILRNTQAADPKTIRPMHNLVLAYLKAGKADEAEAFLESVLQANDKNAEAHVLMGLVKYNQKKLDEAEASYRLAIESQPANPVGYVALARHQAEAQKFAEAEATLKLSRSKTPDDAATNMALASILERRQDIEGAIALYEEQLKTQPGAVIVINNLASLLADHRSDAASLDHAHQISRRLAGIELPQFKDTLGWIAYRRGEYQEALDLLADAAAKAPNLAPARYHLAMTYVALKRPAEALEHFKAASANLKDDDPLMEQIRAGMASAAAPKQE